jgi:hypothetical protein
LALGTSSAPTPRRRQARPTASSPRTGWIWPSRASSPTTAHGSVRLPLTTPVAARIPSAMGRSKDVPSLRMSADARLTVTRSERTPKPGVANGRLHPLTARTAESGRPTVAQIARPLATSTSTRTRTASIPMSAAESTRATTGRFLGTGRRRQCGESDAGREAAERWSLSKLVSSTDGAGGVAPGTPGSSRFGTLGDRGCQRGGAATATTASSGRRDIRGWI